MAAVTYSLKLSLLFIVFFIAFDSQSITYQTMNSGSWNDVASVWSTDGGVTPCGCSPGTAPGANTIIVDHNLNVPSNLNLTNTILTLNASGQMNGAYNIAANSATVDIFGNMTLTKYDQGGASNVTLHPGAIMLASNAFAVNGGTILLNGAVINCGGLDIAVGASMSLMNSARFFIVSGNSVVDGSLDIGAGCCMESNGNWKVNATGQVTGSGSFNSGGNINNQGSVDLTIIWCSQGTALGMPTPENCAAANGICNAILLPVELTSFNAIVYNNSFAEVTWTTASENNSSHFALMASSDGINWRKVATVEAAGNSQSKIEYSVQDFYLEAGITYYMLYQYDTDGRENTYDPISVSIEAVAQELLAYPNPVKSENTIHVVNVKDGFGTAQLVGLNGIPVQVEDFDAINHGFEMMIRDVNPGVYLLKVSQYGDSRTIRIVVTE